MARLGEGIEYMPREAVKAYRLYRQKVGQLGARPETMLSPAEFIETGQAAPWVQIARQRPLKKKKSKGKDNRSLAEHVVRVRRMAKGKDQ